MAKFTRIGDVLQKKRKKLIIFISTGDTCRAPMASGYFRKLLKEREMHHIEVRDAGIMTVSGLRATAEAIQVLDTVDVDLRRHSSRKLSNESIKRADLILGMSSFHVQTALRQTEHAKNKTVLLKEFVDWEHKNVQISDPMGGTLEVYKKCFQEIKEACDRLVDHPAIAELEPTPEPAEKARAAQTEGVKPESGKKKPAARKKDKANGGDNGDAPAAEAPVVADQAEAAPAKPAAKAKASKSKKGATSKDSKTPKDSKTSKVSEAPAAETEIPAPSAENGEKATKPSASKTKKKATSSKKKS